MLMSGVMYLMKSPEVVEGFKTLGFPDSFRILLGTAKLLGALALVIPVWDKLKEWAYAGLAFTFISAVYVHIYTNTPFVGALVAMAMLGVSYFFWNRIKAAKAV